MSEVAADATGRTLVAVGSAANEQDRNKPGYAVVWRSTDGGTSWTRVPTSKDVAGTGTRSWLEGIGWLAGRFVAVGTGGDYSAACAWSSADGVHWTRTSMYMFGDVGPFAYNGLSAATTYHGRWLAVGWGSTDGAVAQSALVFDSADGRAWHAKTSDDLNGVTGGARAIMAVAVAGDLTVAVGQAERSPGAVAGYPAAWASTDGATWRLAWLPLPAGATSGSAGQVAAHGGVEVAIGTVSVAAHNQAVAWVSRDGGRTWALAPLPDTRGPGGDASPGLLVATGAGFLADVTDGRYGSQRLRLWSSTDGQHWQPVTPRDPRLRESGGDWTLLDGVVVGDRLAGLVTHTTTAGRAQFTFVQPL